jgi:hypothetical protein
MRVIASSPQIILIETQKNESVRYNLLFVLKFFSLNDNAGLVTNFEVYKIMQENEDSKKRPIVKETDMSTSAQQLNEELKQFEKQVTTHILNTMQ